MTLKSGEKVIDHKIEYIEDKNVNVFIGENWTSIDLSIFNANELIYIEEFSPMRKLRLSTNLIHSASYNFENKKYKNCKVDFYIHCGEQKYDYFSPSMNDYEKFISNTNEYIFKITDSREKKNEIIFVKKDEIKQNNNFMEYICKFMAKRYCDELWIFDPYLLHDTDIFIDWIKFLSGVNTQKINIVISKDKLEKYTHKPIQTVKKEVDNKINSLKNLILSNINKINKDIYVYSTEKNNNIHDRFILKKQNISDSVSIFSGLSIGTSFNSLHNNYYCIYELDNNISEYIFNNIIKCVENKLFNISIKVSGNNHINKKMKRDLCKNRKRFEISKKDLKDLEKNIYYWRYDEINYVYSQGEEIGLELKNRLRKNKELGYFLYKELKKILKDEMFNYYPIHDLISFHENTLFKNTYLVQTIKLLFLIDPLMFRELALKEDKYNFIINNFIHNFEIYFDFDLIKGIIDKVDKSDEITNLNRNIGLCLFIQNIKDGKINECDKFFKNLSTSLKVDLIINGLSRSNACKTNSDMKNNVDFFRKFIDDEFINEFIDQLKNSNNVKDIFHLKEIIEFLPKQCINENMSVLIINILAEFIRMNIISIYTIGEYLKYTILILNNLESKFIDEFKEKLKLIDKDLMCEEIDKLVRRIIFDNDNEKHKYINRILNEFKN